MSVEIIDDFLPKDYFLSIQELFLNDNFPWYYYPFSNIENKNAVDSFYFVHSIYNLFKPMSDVYASLDQVFIKLQNEFNMTSILRAKANLQTKSKEVKPHGGFHVDYNFDCKTAILYLNTNNGLTLFEDGTKIESISNRFIIFDSKLKHTGTTHTDTNIRCLINFNFYTSKYELKNNKE